jgi:hypothetical protein
VKRFTSIALIFLLSLQCFYKLGVITYFQLNRQYIAEVLCINKEKPITMCYGRCFLDKNLEIADDTNDDGALPASKQLIDFPVFLVSESNYCLGLTIKPAKGHCRYITASSTKHSSAPFHPPAVVS